MVLTSFDRMSFISSDLKRGRREPDRWYSSPFFGSNRSSTYVRKRREKDRYRYRWRESSRVVYES